MNLLIFLHIGLRTGCHRVSFSVITGNIHMKIWAHSLTHSLFMEYFLLKILAVPAALCEKWFKATWKNDKHSVSVGIDKLRREVTICSHFQRKRNFLLKFLFFQSIFGDWNSNFQQNFFYIIEDIDFFKSNVKRFFYLRSFFAKLREFKINLAMIWANICALWSFYS